MLKSQSCDRDCPDRCPGCGATCPKWAEHVKARDAEYRRRKAEAEVISARIEGGQRRGSYTPKT